MTSAAETMEGHEQRAHLRLTLQAEGRLSEPYSGNHGIELLDISATGARIATFRRFHPGQAVYLTVDQIRAIKCEVRWARAGEIGVAFERPLHVAVLEHLATAHRAR
ncbi:PilZ domain-containing protein [Sphingomonas sp.]|uniref:PilZ domain-containing protein n=1 Tax=Sphingomonas sp. TaxID=28214 RepID=UPI002CE34F7A|nr:PilZ domain-containing protein [Sphingomonas sp.]HTG39280.1 PilZ domain-containing protein [Sphingomonas sp.]